MTSKVDRTWWQLVLKVMILYINYLAFSTCKTCNPLSTIWPSNTISDRSRCVHLLTSNYGKSLKKKVHHKLATIFSYTLPGLVHYGKSIPFWLIGRYTLSNFGIICDIQCSKFWLSMHTRPLKKFAGQSKILMQLSVDNHKSVA